MNEQVLRLEDVELHFPRKEGALSILKRLVMGFFGKSERGPRSCGLSEINLTIQKGEIIGIIGRNGSGKSTLLRTIAGIYKPDSGWIGIDGQTSLLAGVGVGMNKDLTGRENIHLYGSMLGHERSYMDSMMEEIIQFSELQEFIDEPLRTYSSGMKARLGISVATAVKPDILLIDEVLGVGDPGFKKRSQQRIRDMMDDSNTVILVSHSFGLLKEICSRMIMMEKGKMKCIGTPDEVIGAYHEAEG
ncbi:MAG: teichoic acid ABC transporter ATP-binding protein [Opitutae bacterium]|nr:teichoic acid ABC transporter ATP-binding protein [Opitutae bacterium]